MSTLSKEGLIEDNLSWYVDGETEKMFPYLLPSKVSKIMDEYAKQEVMGYEIWKKRQGVMWNVENASTPAEKLHEQYILHKQKQG